MRTYFLIIALGLFTISSCGNKNEYISISDDGLTLMAIRQKKEGLVKVRVAFDKYAEGLDVQRFATSMQYQMDSCFYLFHEGKKSYPLYITPVANGLDKNFEYMIGFADKHLEEADKLVYFDCHQSQKNIELTFKP